MRIDCGRREVSSMLRLGGFVEDGVDVTMRVYVWYESGRRLTILAAGYRKK